MGCGPSTAGGTTHPNMQYGQYQHNVGINTGNHGYGQSNNINNGNIAGAYGYGYYPYNHGHYPGAYGHNTNNHVNVPNEYRNNITNHVDVSNTHRNNHGNQPGVNGNYTINHNSLPPTNGYNTHTNHDIQHQNNGSVADNTTQHRDGHGFVRNLQAEVQAPEENLTMKDFRSEPRDRAQMTPPSLAPGHVWVDRDYPLQVAIKDWAKIGLTWKRTWELCHNPVLFTDGTTRFDIGQGRAGTCWFLAMLSSISDRPELLRKVVDSKSYNPMIGVFHCRFWKFGVWEDVYIDDHLPVHSNNNTYWGAHSETDRNEMWVSLIEKAFSKFHGSYDTIWSGHAEDAYLAFTGGVADRIEVTKDTKPEDVVSSIKTGLESGALCSCSAEDIKEDIGLVAKHAYALNNIKYIEYPGREEYNFYLVRLRNPWGYKEWNGAFSDGHETWSRIPSGFTSQFAVTKEDGEFWMTFKDFLKYFQRVAICQLTPHPGPDFDPGLKLDNELAIYGQWRGITAAGSADKMKNPKYSFTVDKNENAGKAPYPLVIQFIQRKEHNKSDTFFTRCDLYKVVQRTNSLEQHGKCDNVYTQREHLLYRHKVDPGRYVVIPSTLKPREENEYLIRIFSNCSLTNCSIYKTTKKATHLRR